MDIHGCNLIRLCFFGLTTFKLFPGFSNSVLFPELSTALGCPKLSLRFHLGQEKEKEKMEMHPSLILQALWYKFFIFSCKDKSVTHDSGVSSLPIAPLHLCKF